MQMWGVWVDEWGAMVGLLQVISISWRVLHDVSMTWNSYLLCRMWNSLSPNRTWRERFLHVIQGIEMCLCISVLLYAFIAFVIWLIAGLIMLLVGIYLFIYLFAGVHNKVKNERNKKLLSIAWNWVVLLSSYNFWIFEGVYRILWHLKLLQF